MRERGLRGCLRGRRGSTTRGDRGAVAAPDLVRRKFAAAEPDRLWMADITYVRTGGGSLYPAFVLGACSRRPVGRSMAPHLKTGLVVDALEMAVWRRKPGSGLIHHADRGSRYAALSFGGRLEEVGIVPSTGRAGSAPDNAMAESFVSTPKAEPVDRHRFPTRQAARLAFLQSTSRGSTTARGGTRLWATRAPRTTKHLGWRRRRWRSDGVSTEVK